MRLLSRHAPVQELVDSTGDVVQADRFEVPPKAQKILGEKPLLNYNTREIVTGKSDPIDNDSVQIPLKAQKLLGETVQPKHKRNETVKHSDPDSLWNIRDAEQKSLGTLRDSEADSDTIPGAKTGAPLPYVPVPMRSSEDLLRSSNDSTGRTGTSTYPPHQPSIESMSREYYDPSKQPLYVSQQTSESSVRDMALRRGAPPVSDTSSEAPLIAHPLKNVFQHRRPGRDRTLSDEPKKERKIDLMSLFPQPKSSGGVPSGKGSQSAGLSPISHGLSRENTVQAHIVRQGSKLCVEKDYRTKPLPSHPNASNTGRAKVFESDVYDSKKTHVYRPPKGAKNWFDGLDISSDEDEYEPEPQLQPPPEPEPVEIAPVELPANEVPRVYEALPSVFSLYGTPTREFTAPYYDSWEPEYEDNAPSTRRSQEAMRRRMQHIKSQSSIAANDALFEVAAERKRSGESRLEHSRLGAESVLSLSDESGEPEGKSPAAHIMGNDLAVIENASSLEMQRPSLPARKLSSQAREAQFRRVDSGAQRSRSVQEKLIDDTTPPPVSRGKGSVLSDSSPRAHRELNALRESPAQSLPRRRRTNDSNERAKASSPGGGSNSSFPLDVSHIMAVTEEEMMLLELMRQKRAAMQNDSFSEGYRIAQEERQSLAQEQGPTQDYGSLNAKTNERPRPNRSASSRTENPLREEMEHRRQMSAIRKEDVDSAFKMGRFLAMEHPNDDKRPKMERFLNMAPGLSGEFGERPVSGTEIEIESRYDELEETEEECESESDEKETEESKGEQSYENCVQYDLFHGDESRLKPDEGPESDDMRTPRQAQAFSPMQRLTEQVREGSAKDPQSSGEHVDQFGESYQTLGSANGSRTTATGTLPTPPIDDIREQSIMYDVEGRELLSPTVYTPSIRGPAKASKPATPEPVQDHDNSLDEQKASETKLDGPEMPVATTWARPSSLKHPQPQRQRPVLDFTPMELRPAPSIASNSLSPMTPTLEPMPRSPDEAASEVTSFDTASVPSERFIAPSGAPQPLKSHPVSPGFDRKSSKSSRPSSKSSTFPQKAPGRITSMTSITSAGEDVLAAWAELGGGSDALAFRRKRNR